MELTAGYGVADITPEVGCLLDGFIARLSPSPGIDTPLFARALYLAQGAVRSLIFSLDVMGLQRNFAELFAREVGIEFGIDPGNVVAFCSHTHAGPMTETLRRG